MVYRSERSFFAHALDFTLSSPLLSSPRNSCRPAPTGKRQMAKKGISRERSRPQDEVRYLWLTLRVLVFQGGNRSYKPYLTGIRPGTRRTSISLEVIEIAVVWRGAKGTKGCKAFCSNFSLFPVTLFDSSIPCKCHRRQPILANEVLSFYSMCPP